MILRTEDSDVYPLIQLGTQRTAFGLVAFLALSLVGCDGPPRSSVPKLAVAPQTISSRASSKEVRDFVVNNAFAAAAEESQNQATAVGAVVPQPAVAAPAPAPTKTTTTTTGINVRIGPPVVREAMEAAKLRNSQTAIRLPGVRSRNLHTTKEAAISDALQVARLELMKQLEAMEPAIHARPSLVTMKWEYLKSEPQEVYPTEAEKQKLRENGLSGNLRWAVLDLELSDEQVRSLRASDRVTDAFRIGAVILAILAGIYGFLRLDQWTKGYLTMWLGIGAVVLVVGVIIAVS